MRTPCWIHEYNFILKLIATFGGVYLAFWLNDLNEKNVYLKNVNKSIVEVQSILGTVSADCRRNYIDTPYIHLTAIEGNLIYEKEYQEPTYFIRLINHSDKFYKQYINYSQKLRTTLVSLNNTKLEEERIKKINLLNIYKENLEFCLEALTDEKFFLENRKMPNRPLTVSAIAVSPRKFKIEKSEYFYIKK